MERYIVRSGQANVPHLDTSAVHQTDKVTTTYQATDPVIDTDIAEPAASQPLILSQEDSMEIPATPSDLPPSGSTPLIDYKQLAIEVAMRIAPDLQDTLQHTIQTSLNRFQADLSIHSSRLEQRVGTLEDENMSLQEKVRSLSLDKTRMNDKIDDLENRSRRNNLRLVGLPEVVKATDLHRLCEVDLPKALGINHSCRVERAHRIGRDPNSNGANSADVTGHPRQVIMKYLDFNDKTEILRAYRKKETTLQLKGTKILLFEDFSVEVSRRRRAFGEVCSQLFHRKVRFRLVYPATLIVSPENGPPQSFTTPEKAKEALSKRFHIENTEDKPTPHRAGRKMGGEKRPPSSPHKQSSDPSHGVPPSKRTDRNQRSTT